MLTWEAVRRLALIAPTLADARRAARLLAPLRGEIKPYSLDGFLAASRTPRNVILCPGGPPQEALDFLRSVRRRILWPSPAARLREAIAGLRGGHGELEKEGERRRSKRRESALLLEGEVTAARAQSAISRSELSRDWVVEHPRSVKLSEQELVRLARRGVRWFTLTPVTVEAVAGVEALARRRASWRRLVPPGTPLWPLEDREGRSRPRG